MLYTALPTLLNYILLLFVFLISMQLQNINSLMRGFVLVMLLFRVFRDRSISAEPEVWAEVSAPLLLYCMVQKDWLFAGAILLGLWPSRIAFVTIGAGLLLLPGWRIISISCIAVAPIITMFFPDKFESALARVDGWNWGWSQMSWAGQGIGWLERGEFAQQFLQGHELVHSDLMRLCIEMGVGAVVPVTGVCWLLIRKAKSASWFAFGALALESIVSFPLHLPLGSGLAALWAGQLARRPT